MENNAWNLESEYPSIHSEVFKKDWRFVTDFITQSKTVMSGLDGKWSSPNSQELEQIKKLFKGLHDFYIIGGNIGSYLHFTLTIDTTATEIIKKKSEFEALFSQANQAFQPLHLFVKQCDDSIIAEMLKDPELKDHEFIWNESRKQRVFALSEKEEVLVEALSQDGFHAWSRLYDQIAGQTKCQLHYPDRTETVGLAKAAALTKSPDEPTRKVAWHAVQDAWNTHRVTSAAILNAIAGHRIEMNKKRSHTQPKHFLHDALVRNRMTRETLDALIGACKNNLQKTRQSPRMMARLLKKDVIAPWDLLAPGPEKADKSTRSFEEGVNIVKQAFGGVSHELSDFVDMAYKKNWIEGRVLPNKGAGAYCGGFPKSRESRVFMTYMGSNSEISTLAHELGHAYHGWVMRDLPLEKSYYPMALAETASIFAETVLHHSMIDRAQNNEEKLDFAWSEIEAINSMLINIPARFEFENEFYERRHKGILVADELSELMDQTWTKWWGPTISQNDRLFWASKLHFSMTRAAFYNFPYTFGYLFSLSIYARKEELGADFMKTYVNILRDTGSMSSEELIQKHLGEDIREQKFWQKAIDHVVNQMNSYEPLLKDFPRVGHSLNDVGLVGEASNLIV